MEKPDMSQIPLTPGVYIYKNGAGKILYIGKAKQLRKRLASYFRPESALAPKTISMLSRATQLETITTSTENEALLLEASLIKKHRPRYNIVLRDDKEYLLFRIATDVPFPRLEVVRQVRKAKSRRKARIFGPYSSARDARATWKLLHRIFPLRRCTDRSFKNRSKACLYHHIGQCLAPCVLPVSPEDYSAVVSKIVLLLEGRSGELVQGLRAEMEQASENLNFEQAALLRDQIRAVENTLEAQSVVLDLNKDMDVIGLAETEKGLGLGQLFVRGGALLGSGNFYWPGLGFQDGEELLSSFLLQYYIDVDTIPPQLVLPWLPGGAKITGEDENPDDAASDAPGKAELESLLGELRQAPVRISLPRNSAEEKLVNLASANAREAARQKRDLDMGSLLATVFSRSEPVERIEAVDVSHTSGRQTRAGMVVFEGGQPLRSDWRNYAFEDSGGDDYAVLAAWAERRINSGAPWPDLLLIDGGRGQLGAVYRVFSEHGLEKELAIASIAKARDEDGHADRRAGNVGDRIFVPGRSNPLNLKAGSPELLYLQHVRNHVHDFSIGRHRQARNNQALVGELNRIPGVGPGLVRELWSHFNSIQEMAAADDTALLAVPGLGRQRLKALREHLALVLDATGSKQTAKRNKHE